MARTRPKSTIRRYRFPAALAITATALAAGSSATLAATPPTETAKTTQVVEGSGPDLTRLEDALRQLQRDKLAATFLAAGSGQARDGAEQLEAGAAELAAGIGQARGGSEQLAAGTGELAAGAGQLKDGTSQLRTGMTEFQGGIGQLGDGASQISGGVDELVAQLLPLKSADAPFAPEIAAALIQLEQLRDGARQLAFQLNDPSSDFRVGAAQLSDGANQVDSGAGQLATGSAELRDGAGQLRDGLVQLDDGSGQLTEGSRQLVAGLGQLGSTAEQVSTSVNGVVSVTPRASLTADPVEVAVAQPLGEGRVLDATTMLALLGLGAGGMLLLVAVGLGGYRWRAARQAA
ncbi:hypothetical protein HT102_04815 [Hoyosella sp. G463]|uniref:Uncharacterized protein n=1 Tax=Lolliginicoccus lacisalsi TaxID=2742202 RepID=A0A927PLW9_9ACTN|nr:hypothetical protein [Lolliginicoccus lacisalsi]MBD8505806.1 hypothetical protein [Lolliginicoccus lacisalsi]